MSFLPDDVERVKVISDREVIRNVLRERGRYAMYVGAGASAEAEVPTADSICEEARRELLHAADLGPRSPDEWADVMLDWSDTSQRYMTCIRKWLPNEAARVEQFRRVLATAGPSFCHHAIALLMSYGYLHPTSLTTNFDHLIERAFSTNGLSECVAIRTKGEAEYWEQRNDRYYLVKLHGDIDTLNILNTPDETMTIEPKIQEIVEAVAQAAGLVVLGTAGNETSVRTLFRSLVRPDGGPSRKLAFGLLWGVYMGSARPASITPEQLKSQVQERLAEGQINRDIVRVMGGPAAKSNELFCFFPVWGAGAFMRDLVAETQRKPLIGLAMQHLDHEMRLRHVFTDAGLTDEAVTRHLDALRRQRERLRTALPRARPEQVLAAASRRGSAELRVVYADISSRSLMGAEEFTGVRRAVVSPEDTFISAGGGVAYLLLRKAGSQTILNELAKFAPIPQRTVAVTSGGALPVQYVFHAATIKLDTDGAYVVSKDDVRATAVAVLETATALGVGVVWIPLLAAGVASLQPEDSFSGLLEGVRSWTSSRRRRPAGLTITIVVYQERELPRATVLTMTRNLLEGFYELAEPAPPIAVT